MPIYNAPTDEAPGNHIGGTIRKKRKGDKRTLGYSDLKELNAKRFLGMDRATAVAEARKFGMANPNSALGKFMADIGDDGKMADTRKPRDPNTGGVNQQPDNGGQADPDGALSVGPPKFPNFSQKPPVPLVDRTGGPTINGDPRFSTKPPFPVNQDPNQTPPVFEIPPATYTDPAGTPPGFKSGLPPGGGFGNQYAPVIDGGIALNGMLDQFMPNLQNILSRFQGGGGFGDSYAPRGMNGSQIGPPGRQPNIPPGFFQNQIADADRQPMNVDTGGIARRNRQNIGGGRFYGF